ncbi:FadR family transcriptional regulator [Clostridium sp. MSJ-4]|uniref:FadR family transcriptional regulator n=1 Tax=Clostridium simiarum TaxID=2841506 RepID=A0ABS6F283_9CLOT|nr:FadR/GntR family transcriptional regulator [Clostridium simiarum]MBU5591652.1 FadR family transcriptional regulator [Clostridium simiarum]
MNEKRKMIPHKLVDQVIHQLQKDISLGYYIPGQKIPTEPELMELFGVGRSTLREAIKVLSSSGLLEVRQGEGTFVCKEYVISEPLDQRLRRASLLEIYEVRRMLELQIAELAAMNRTEKDLLEMKSSLDKRRSAEKTNDINAYVEHDWEFHNAMASATQNSVLKDLYITFSQTMKDSLKEVISDFESVKRQIQYHDQVYKAIERQDTSAARNYTNDYLDITMKQLL